MIADGNGILCYSDKFSKKDELGVEPYLYFTGSNRPAFVDGSVSVNVKNDEVTSFIVMTGGRNYRNGILHQLKDKFGPPIEENLSVRTPDNDGVTAGYKWDFIDYTVKFREFSYKNGVILMQTKAYEKAYEERRQRRLRGEGGAKM